MRWGRAPLKQLLLCTVLLSVQVSGLRTGVHSSMWPHYYEGMPLPRRDLVLDMAKDFSAVGDSRTINTEAFEDAVRYAKKWNENHHNAGVSLQFTREGGDVYLTAPVNLTSHLTLTIAEGVTLRAVDNPSAWPLVAPLPSYGQGRDSPPHGPRRCSFLGGVNVSDIAITGPGTIDGAGARWWAAYKEGKEIYTRGRLIEFLFTDGILLHDLHLINSPYWTIHPVYSSNVVARLIRIDNPQDVFGTDGFDPDSCVNVSLVDSTFSVGDDGVAIKSGWDCFGLDFGRPSSNILIRNLSVDSPCCSGVTIGSEMSGGVSNVLVLDSHFKHVGIGLRVKTGVGRGGYVEDIYFSNIEIEHVDQYAIQVNDFYGGPNPSCDGRNATAIPHVHALSFENITAYGTGAAADLQGLSGSPIVDVTLSNVILNVQNNSFYCKQVGGTFSGRCIPKPCDEFKPNN